LAELDDGILSHAGVGAGGASLGAIETELDAVHERVVDMPADPGMCGSDGFDVHVLLL
jgi:hypothetical protein